MKVLLTGAAGFLGRNLLLQAPADWEIVALYRGGEAFPGFVRGLANPRITAVPCDLSDPAAVSRLCETHGAEWESCVYLAAKVDIPWSVREPNQDLLANVSPLLNLLERVRVAKLVYFSSGAVYDGCQGEATPSTPVRPTLPYAISKLACERYVESFVCRRRTVERFLTVRFFGAYGPFEAEHKIYTRLIRAFCVDKQDTYTLYGDGQNLIDAMYVDDAVDAVRRMLAGSHWNDTVNLAGGHPITVESLVRQVAAAIHAGTVRIEKQGVAHESNQFWGSTREMKEIFGFEPRVPLAEGIQRFRDFQLTGNHR